MWRGSFVLLATVGLGSLRPSPAGWKRWGRGHPVSSASRLNGPTAGCVPVEAVAYASGPSLAGRGCRVAQSWGAPGAAGSCGRLEGCGLRLGLLLACMCSCTLGFGSHSSRHLCTIWSWQHGAAVPIFLRAPLPRSVFAEGIYLLSAGLRPVAKGSPPLL